MNGKILVLAALMAAVPAAVAAKDSEPELLAHSGKWQVDYDKEACHLLGKFGEGSDQVIARFTRYQPDDAFDLTLYGQRMQGLKAKIDVELAFGPGGGATKKTALTGIADEKPMLILSGLRLDGRSADGAASSAITPTQEAATADATFRIPRKRAFRLGFGSLGAPLAALRACQTDLLRHWGFDPDVQARLSRPVTPVGDPVSWLNSVDYTPAEEDVSAEAPANALVQFRLDVDPEGVVSACHILYRTKPDAFAGAACRSVQARARFRPALDAAGKPVRSFYIGKASWQAS